MAQTILGAEWLFSSLSNTDWVKHFSVNQQPTFAYYLLKNGALCFDTHSGRILGVDTFDNLIQQYPNAQKQFLKQQLIMPGFVNAHNHAAMSLMRGFANDWPLMDWLQKRIWPAESQFVNEAFVKDGVQLALLEMIASGTTCSADMYFFPDIALQTAANAGFNWVGFAPILDFPNPWADTPQTGLQQAEQLLKQNSTLANQRQVLQYGLGPHAPYTVSNQTVLALLELIQLYPNTPMQVHLHETAYEVHDFQQNKQMTPIEYWHSLGFFDNVSSPLSCVHMTQLDDKLIQLLTQTKSALAGKFSVVHCPESNLKLGSGMCPTHQIVDANLTLAIGTDGPASNNDLDMIQESRTAALLSKGLTQDPTRLGAAQVLSLATLGGAKALGLEHRIGSLEPGKQADCISINLDQAHFYPIYDPIGQWVYCGTGRDIDQVWIAGQCVYQNKQVLLLDTQAIFANAVAWQKKLSSLL